MSFIFIGTLHGISFSSSLVCDEPLRSAIKAARQNVCAARRGGRGGVNVPAIPVEAQLSLNAASSQFTKENMNFAEYQNLSGN